MSTQPQTLISAASFFAQTPDERAYQYRIKTGQAPMMLRKKCLKDFLNALRREAHYIFALLESLPLSQFSIIRTLDYRAEINGQTIQEIERFSLRDFYNRAVSLHKNDEFEIMFGDEFIYFEEELTRELIEQLYESYMERLCEKNMRDNNPLRLSRSMSTNHKLSRSDVAQVKERLERYNAAVIGKLQAEYDALKRLRCIKR